MVRIHPYQYANFNRIAGGIYEADDNYMLDYWGLAFKQAAQELRTKLTEQLETPTKGRRWRVAVCGPHAAAEVELGPEFVTTWEPAGADFAMMLGDLLLRGIRRAGACRDRARGRDLRARLRYPRPPFHKRVQQSDPDRDAAADRDAETVRRNAMPQILPQTFVFDAYGTLLDVHSAIARHRDAAGPDADRFSEVWRTKQLEYSWTLTLAGDYQDFWVLTQRALDFAFARFPSVDRGAAGELLDAYFTLGAFPDALPVLTALKTAGHATAILSNGSPDMLAAAVKAGKLDTSLDATLSIDSLRMYKPRAEVYALVTDRFGVKPADVTFISSNRWDVMGSCAFGFKPVWVNRAGNPDEYPDHPPVRVIASLNSLLTVA